MVFADWQVSSAPLLVPPEARILCFSPELVEWAERISCVEKQHERKLLSRFRAQLKATRVICLGTPDDYLVSLQQVRRRKALLQ